MIKICVSGAKGRIGSRVIDLAKEDAAFQVCGEFDIGVDPEPLIAAGECLIDFTTPEATMKHLALCERLKKGMVIGTTGISETDRHAIQEASAAIPIVLSPNMSIGVNTLFKLVEDAAKTLGKEYKVEILEAHHTHKKDSPSGTAKELVRIIKDVKGKIEVPVESIREDEIVGEHTVTFESPFDILEMTHSAKTRDIFVKGALEAAKWLAGKEPGLYTMKDVLGL